MTAFPIPIVKTDVTVAAGVVKEAGNHGEFPTTIWWQGPTSTGHTKDNGREEYLAALSVTRQIAYSV